MQGFQIIRRLLVYKVIQPIGKQQVRVAAPYHRRDCLRVVAGEIRLGKRGVDAAQDIPMVFHRQGIAVVFAVTRDEKLACLLYTSDAADE